MEFLKKRMRERQYEYEQTSTRVTITLSGPSHLMYCMSIAPDTSHKSKLQRKHLSTNYDFMTRINNPARFAKQLGDDFGKQVKIKAPSTY